MDKGTLLGHCTENTDLEAFGSDDFLRIKHAAAHKGLGGSSPFVTITEQEQL